MTPSKVFISYAREDKEAALRLYRALRRVGCDPWIDSEDLPVGAIWRREVKTAIRQSRFFIVLLSKRSMTKRGFVHHEIREALDIVQDLPETERFLLPVRLETCEITHDNLRELHWIDLFPNWDRGFKKLLKSIGHSDTASSPDESLITNLRNALELIETKLAVLIGTSFREARILLLEEKSEALRERLTKAIAFDELDLPSLVLYCYLLGHSGQENLAQDYYRDIVLRFGPHPELFPVAFLSRLGGDPAELERLARIDELENAELSLTVEGWFVPKDVWCTLWGIISLWKHGSWLYRLGDFAPKLFAHDWSGKILLKMQERNLSVVSATGGYVTIRSGRSPGSRIVSIPRAQELLTQKSERELECLFPPESSVVQRLASVQPGASAEFKGVKLRFETHEYYEVETISIPYSAERSYSYKKREAGKIAIALPAGRLTVTSSGHAR